MTDRIAGLHARLAALDDTPVDGHPDVLEAVHRDLIAELDDLAGGIAGQGRDASRPDRHHRG